MSERDEKRGGSGCLIWGAVLVIFPVLYVLGLGPAIAIALRFPATKHFVSAVYKPLLYLGEHFEPIRRVFDWYTDLWM